MAEAVSGLAGSLQGSLTGMLGKGQQWLDNIFPPEKRNELTARLSKFLTEKPMLASFILSHLALSGIPLGLFVLLTITVIIFALLAGIIIGLIGALLFIVVCVGFALVILLPALFFTTAAATFVWLWGIGAYYLVKWFNKKEIPGIHKPLGEGMEGGLKGQLGGLMGEEGKGDTNGAAKGEDGGEKGGLNGAAKSSGVDVGNPKEAADVGKVAGKAHGAAGGVKRNLPGVPGVPGS